MATWILWALVSAVGGEADCTIVHFTAAWCKPCQQVAPSLQRLQHEGWDVRTVDVDRESQLTQQYQIKNLPTVVILCRQQEVDRLVGAASYEQIQQRATRAAARNQSGAARNSTNSRASTPELGTQPAAAQAIVRGQSPSLTAFPMLASVVSETPADPNLTRQAFGEPPPRQQIPVDLASSRSEVPVSRSQQPAAAPSLSIEQAIARAAAATVRIRVDEANTTAYGTGTIVDVHGSEALILTCGHLFRDMKPNSQLTIDLFAGTPQEINLPSQLIDFKAEQEDIGLISVQLPVAIEPVPILARGEPLQIGQPAFSFGCDHGENPTRRDTRIKSINRYLGADNIEIAGAPAVGRSGGGLFDTQGRLIGVCNAADSEGDEGIYAAAEVVYSQIERLGLSHLFEKQPVAASGQLQFASTQAGLPGSNAHANDWSPTAESSSFDSDSIAWPDQAAVMPQGLAASASTPVELTSSSPAEQAPQVICIVRSGNGQDQVVTIDAPPAELLQLIHRAGQR